MRFIVSDARASVPKLFPTAVLRRNNWDDYGLKTTNLLVLHLSNDRAVELGDVKILKQGQQPGYTPLPKEPFRQLSERYCSLGQAFSYYETLLGFGDAIYRPLLEGLRDVVFDRRRLAMFEEEAGFQTSLLRASSAELALRDAPSLFHIRRTTTTVSEELRFSFKTNVGGKSF